jgi:hypothetical protein
VQRKFNLHVRIEIPIRSYVGRTIIHHDVTLEVLELFLDEGDALGSGDVALEGHTALDRLDWVQIDTDLDRRPWHVFGRDLEPVIKKELV